MGTIHISSALPLVKKPAVNYQISDETLMDEKRVYDGSGLHKLEPKELGLAIVPNAALADFSFKLQARKIAVQN